MTRPIPVSRMTRPLHARMRAVDDVAPLIAAGVPVNPPRAWFANPSFPGPMPHTVTDDGRVFGHAALWSSCHIGYPGRCVPPPRSSPDYPWFHLGEVECDDGSTVAVGQLTMRTRHAGLRDTADEAVAHYDHTGMAVADVCVGDDAFGIWYAGAVRPTLSLADLREFRGAKFSGDWRGVGRGHEMVGILAVNVPGFPIPRPATRIASGRQVAIVAAGMLPDDLPRPVTDQVRNETDLVRQIARVDPDAAIDRLARRVFGT